MHMPVAWLKEFVSKVNNEAARNGKSPLSKKTNVGQMRLIFYFACEPKYNIIQPANH
jgi:hypothetical protein